jgi:PleD family two-component response regulator
MSVGIATCEGRQEVATLLRQADARLYQTKRLGRNRVVV